MSKEQEACFSKNQENLKRLLEAVEVDLLNGAEKVTVWQVETGPGKNIFKKKSKFFDVLV